MPPPRPPLNETLEGIRLIDHEAMKIAIQNFYWWTTRAMLCCRRAYASFLEGISGQGCSHDSLLAGKYEVTDTKWLAPLDQLAVLVVLWSTFVAPPALLPIICCIISQLKVGPVTLGVEKKLYVF